MSACITQQEYLSWVISTLNRWLGANLRERGGSSPPYRDWVTEFQTVFAVRTRNGTVDECTQNAMIKANHQDAGYLTWVQKSINQALGRVAVAADGSLTPATTAAIKNFQQSNGMNDDGWVGAKTETALRKKASRKPPLIHHRSVLLIPYNRSQSWGGRRSRDLARFWVKASFLALLHGTEDPCAWFGETKACPPEDTERLQCLLARLLLPDPDDEYIPAEKAKGFHFWGEDRLRGGREKHEIRAEFPKRIHEAWDTLAAAVSKIMTSTFDYAVGYSAFKVQLIELYVDINRSLNFIGGTTGNHWHDNLADDLMHGFVMGKQKAPGSKSILLCFK